MRGTLINLKNLILLEVTKIISFASKLCYLLEEEVVPAIGIMGPLSTTLH